MMKRYPGKKQVQCYDCGSFHCECSVKASSRTYKKVNRAISEKFGMPCPDSGFPSWDFQELLSRL